MRETVEAGDMKAAAADVIIRSLQYRPPPKGVAAVA